MRAAVGGSRPLQAVCKRRPQAAAVGLQRGWEETSVVRSQSPKSSFSGIAAGGQGAGQPFLLCADPQGRLGIIPGGWSSEPLGRK